jgi:hypothetical protein
MAILLGNSRIRWGNPMRSCSFEVNFKGWKSFKWGRVVTTQFLVFIYYTIITYVKCYLII